MRLSFHPDGTPAAMLAETPVDAATDLDKDLEIPDWAARRGWGAVNVGRGTDRRTRTRRHSPSSKV